jgi:hypothetical protein
MGSLNEFLGLGGWAVLALTASIFVSIGIRIVGMRRADRRLQAAIDRILFDE